jgi:predicted transcriptional regulator
MRFTTKHLIFLILLVFFFSVSANSQSTDQKNGLVYTDGQTVNPTMNPNSGNWVFISFFDLPLWVQLTYLCANIILITAMFNGFPIVLGRLKNIMDNEKRQAILSYIMNNPGCTIADISDTQKINRGTVKYHIFQLELNGKVFTKHENKFARLFHKTSEFRDMERVVTPYLRNDMSKAILLVIMDSPGITNQDLSSKFNLDKSTVHWYLQKFNNDGIINFVKEGKFRKCFINTDAKLVMLRFMPA